MADRNRLVRRKALVDHFANSDLGPYYAVNIGLFGEPGVGKSSLLNSWMRSIHGREKNVQKVQPGGQNCTVQYKAFNLFEGVEGCSGWPLRIFDTRGMPPIVYNPKDKTILTPPQKVICQCLDGAFSEGFEMHVPHWFAIPNWYKKIHCVVLVVSYTVDPKVIDDSNSFYQFISAECKKRNLPLVIAATWEDKTPDEIYELTGHTKAQVDTALLKLASNGMKKIANYPNNWDVEELGVNDPILDDFLLDLLFSAVEKGTPLVERSSCSLL